jgi:hypothetical protein
MEGATQAVLIALAALAGFTAFFSLILFVLATVGGWGRLAQRYRTDRLFQGTIWKYQFGFMGGVRYNGALTVGSGMEGFYLAVLPLLRPFHPPLLIPWSDVSVGQRKQALWMQLVELRLGAGPLASLWVSAALAQQIASAPGAYLRGAETSGLSFRA